ATELGREELKWIPDIKVVVGRKNADEIAALLWTGDFKYCIDATHPYATEVTANIEIACMKTGICYDRLVREKEPIEFPGETVWVDSAAQAGQRLEGASEPILITTGAKEANDFVGIPTENRYIRILNTPDSIRLCKEAGFLEDHILTGHGPFTVEQNIEAIKQSNATCLVTKESGANSGFKEKIEACKQTGVIPIVIRRPKEDGKTMEQLLKHYERIMEMMQ
nr:precorrin-6A/cobalt-precorrin-6A reductase [Lachnospiraceae bacterium]